VENNIKAILWLKSDVSPTLLHSLLCLLVCYVQFVGLFVLVCNCASCIEPMHGCIGSIILIQCFYAFSSLYAVRCVDTLCIIT